MLRLWVAAARSPLFSSSSVISLPLSASVKFKDILNWLTAGHFLGPLSAVMLVHPQTSTPPPAYKHLVKGLSHMRTL